MSAFEASVAFADSGTWEDGGHSGTVTGWISKAPVLVAMAGSGIESDDGMLMLGGVSNAAMIVISAGAVMFIEAVEKAQEIRGCHIFD